MTIFRFRKIDNILDKKELKDQYIYFSSIEKLNDPCEGLAEIIFSTDKCGYLAWIVCLFVNDIKNISNPNLISFFHKASINHELLMAFLNKRQTELIMWFKNIKNFVERYNCGYFLTEELISFIKEHLTNKKITKYTLKLFLCHLYEDILKASCSYMGQGNFELKYNIGKWQFSDIDGKVQDIIKKVNLDEEQLKNKTKIDESLRNIFHERIIKAMKEGVMSKTTISVIENFVNKLINMSNSHPEVGIACFCKTFESTRMWNEYSGLDGACLEYNYNSNASLITEENKNQIVPIFDVNYSNKPLEKNFFGNLCFHPDAFLLKEETELSEGLCKSYLLEKFPYIITKVDDYDNEKEKRMITFAGANKKYKYNFSDLKSITFAPKINTDKKQEIIKIIDEKCKLEKRKEFIFYQSELDNGRIVRYRVNF